MTDPKHTRRLNRLIWRSQLKAVLRMGGLALIGVGVMFWPSCRAELGPKSTIFSRVVILGAETFREPAMILIGIGLLVFGASWLIPGETYDGP